MTHEEKWKRIGEIDVRLAQIRAEFQQLEAEKTNVLMTRASDENRFFVPWRGRKAS